MAEAEIKVPDSVMRAIVREQIAQLLPDIRREAAGLSPRALAAVVVARAAAPVR